MKFGNRLQEKRAKLSPPYADACIEYVELKTHLKRTWGVRNPAEPTVGSPAPTTLQFRGDQLPWDTEGSPSDVANKDGRPCFPDLVGQILRALADETPTFLRRLDAEVLKFLAFFQQETERLWKMREGASAGANGVGRNNDVAPSAGSEAENDPLLSSPAIPTFDWVCDANVSAILKGVLKLERFLLLNVTGMTGLNLRNFYLTRLSNLPFYQSERLNSLKQSLMNLLSGMQAPSTAISTIRSETASRMFAPSAGLKLFRRGGGSSGNITAQGPGILRPAELPKTLLPQQRVLVSLTGPHGTDIVGCVLDCTAKHGCEIEDFMLARLYHQVTFGVLVRLSPEQVGIFKDLCEAARHWDSTLAFEVHDPGENLPKSMDDAPYEGRIKYAATVLNAAGLTARFLNEWAKLLLERQISVERMTRLNEGKLTCTEFRLSVPGDTDMEDLRTAMFGLSSRHGTDVALQPNNVFRRSKRLVVFDMDSTLIRQEVIDEIAKHAGVVDEVALAMNGEIQFKESLRKRVSLLKGTPTTVVDKVKEALVFTEGAVFLCKALKKLGFKLAVISGTKYVLRQFQRVYAACFAREKRAAARLRFCQPDGKYLTGETYGPLVDGARKAELLEVIAQAENVTLDQVIAVGDGANDLWMLNAAGLGIAFNAKIFLQKNVSYCRRFVPCFFFFFFFFFFILS
ncbi:MAG: hypothetical protein BJ554DRAFT_2625 [Olpidium bornovanus]|uniref:phosphoserine phosphatase n=1 Tax=Olpidium bornovanus TaxID=278681 RepID=A0A8H7ZPQ5_9FUNG|nr:MAG: hypothetical protein BJ554DRAFT_2625 [Olpidium bornovanus]